MDISLVSLAKQLDLKFQGDPNLILTHCCGLEKLRDGGLAYITDPKELKNLDTPEGVFSNHGTNLDQLANFQGAIIVPLETEAEGRNLLFAKDPLAAHVAAMYLLHPQPKASQQIDERAVIGRNVKLGQNVTLDAGVVLYDDVEIGDNTIIRANCVIMHGTRIGKDCLLYPNVSIRENCVLGDRCILHMGAVIGADGFGFFQREGANHKIPQVGNVILGNDVEIGANTCIDRARFYHTIVADGCKLDNLIHIAHNVEMGQHGLMAAQSGVAGSTKIGDYLMMGGQSGIRDNLVIGNKVTLLARTLITSKANDGEVLAGMPSRPISRWRKIEALIGGLENMGNRLTQLEIFAKANGYKKQDSES